MRLQQKTILLTIFVWGSSLLANVHSITAEKKFHDLRNEKKPMVVKFFASWCGPCINSKDAFKELSNEFPNVKFVEVDVDKNAKLSDQYNISSLPTTLFFKDGEVVAKEMGAGKKFKENLKEKINKHLLNK